MLPFSSIDPGAGGGLCAMCLVIVPVAIIVHLVVARVMLASVSIATAVALLILGFWLRFDAGVPERRWQSLPFVFVGFLFAFAISWVAGVVVAALRRPE